MTMLVTLFSRNARNPGSWLIRSASLWGPWSHTAALMPDLRSTSEALAMPGHRPDDARWTDRLRGRVCERDLADFVRRSTQWAAIGNACDAGGLIAAHHWTASTKGTRYDYGWALGTTVLRRRAWQRDDRWGCSERDAVRAMRAGVLRALPPYTPGVMPTRLADMLLTAGGVVLDRQALLAGELRPA